jgi:uncharacterized protein (DUF486 family)
MRCAYCVPDALFSGEPHVLAAADACRPALYFQCLHDFCLVRPAPFPGQPLWILILAGWGIAFVEYCFAVPANYYGHRLYSAAQLKTMQEVITLIVFAIFSVTWLGEPLRWNHAVSFLFLVGAAYFAFEKF